MITEIRTTDTREALFIRLYTTTFPQVATFVRNKNGSFDDAKDVFQEALLIYYEKKLSNGFSPEYDEQHYVKGIARHLWYKKFRKSKTTIPMNENLDSIEQPEMRVSEQLLKHIERSGKKCLELLKSFYYDRLSMKELAVKFGFAGERSATAQKYKCLEKVRNELQQRALNKEDFYE